MSLCALDVLNFPTAKKKKSVIVRDFKILSANAEYDSNRPTVYYERFIAYVRLRNGHGKTIRFIDNWYYFQLIRVYPRPTGSS